VAKKALARQSDVDARSVEVEPVYEGRVTFRAKKGKSLDLEKIHACLQETRLSGKPPGRTSSQIRYLEITALGEVVAGKKELLLKVNGTGQLFRLSDDPKAKADGDEKSPWQRLQEALRRGEKVTGVTGRVHGWSGHFPAVLRRFPVELVDDPKKTDKPPARKPLVLYVTNFQLAEK
jgi:hypothetical protein